VVGSFLAKVFWDTNLLIYLLEDHPVLAERVEQLRRRMLVRGDQLYTSTLTVGELLTKRMRQQQLDLVDRHLAFFRRPAVNLLPFDLRAAPFYARIRSDLTIRPPDAHPIGLRGRRRHGLVHHPRRAAQRESCARHVFCCRSRARPSSLARKI
jgi:predicted nucleic acid-binding protein